MRIKHILILIFLIFLYLNLSCKKLNVEKLTLLDYSNNNKIPKINLIKSGEKIEILDLPYCKKKFRVEYGSNINYIKNNGRKIFQDILKPYDQQAFIDSEKQGLTQISWEKSIFTFNNKPVPLELHFTHKNQNTHKITRIIFPLSLRSQIKENFSDDLKENTKLSILLQKPSDVPNLLKGQINIGKIKNFSLCEKEKYKIEQDKFFIFETPNDETILIAKPQIFDKELGLTILKNLEEPVNNFIKN